MRTFFLFLIFVWLVSIDWQLGRIYDVLAGH